MNNEPPSDRLRPRDLNVACISATPAEELGGCTNRHLDFITMMERGDGGLPKLPVSTLLAHLTHLLSVSLRPVD